MTTYTDVRAQFETRCFGIQFPFSFGVLSEGEDELQTLTPARFTQQFRHLRYLDDGGQERPFLKRWLRDPARRDVSHVVHTPGPTPAGAYNTWRAPLAAQLPPSPTPLAEPIVQYLRGAYGVAGGDFVLDFLANAIQRPGQQARVVLLLLAEANLPTTFSLLHFIRTRVLGAHCARRTDNAQAGLFSRFQDATERCVLLHVANPAHGILERLGVIASTPQWTIDTRWRDPRSAPNRLNIVCTAEADVDALRAVHPASYGRFVLLQNSGRGVPPPEAYWERDDVARSIYDLCMARALPPYQLRVMLQPPPRVTPTPLTHFLAWLARDDENATWGAQELYDMFIEMEPSAHNVTLARFGRMLRPYAQSLRKQRTGAGIWYRVDKPRLRQELTPQAPDTQ